jgi:uncharacterized protein
MRIAGVIWLRDVVDKLLWKHNVTTIEVEEVLNNLSRYRFIERGDVEGEDLYTATGQTNGGRYLIVYFIHKMTGEALIVSARKMTDKEKKSHGKH